MKKVLLALALISPAAHASVDPTIIDYGKHEYLIPTIERVYEWDDTISDQAIASFAECQVQVLKREANTDETFARGVVDLSDYTAYHSGFSDREPQTDLSEDALIDAYYNCLPDVV